MYESNFRFVKILSLLLTISYYLVIDNKFMYFIYCINHYCLVKCS